MVARWHLADQAVRGAVWSEGQELANLRVRVARKLLQEGRAVLLTAATVGPLLFSEWEARAVPGMAEAEAGTEVAVVLRLAAVAAATLYRQEPSWSTTRATAGVWGMDF